MTRRENALLAYRHKQPEWIPAFFMDINLIQAAPQLERYCGLDAGPDGFGCDWTFVPGPNAPMPTPGKETLEDITDWKEVVKFPDLDAIDWAAQADKDVHTDWAAFLGGAGIIPMADGRSAYDDEDRLICCMSCIGPFERLHSLMGFQNALMALLTDPDACYDFFGAVVDYKIKFYEKIAKYYRVDIMNQHDDFGANDRMFMSPDTWRQLLKPQLKRLVEAAHDLGFIYQHHSCGYVEPIVEDMAEIGIDALDILQVCNTQMPNIKKKLNDSFTFVGGFDNQGVFDVPKVDEEAVRAEYRRTIDAYAPGGSYVMMPGSLTFNFLPYLMDEHIKYGLNFYKK